MHYHQGERDSLHITVVAQRIILVVVFGDRSSLGLVRLRVKKASKHLAKIFDDIFKKAQNGEGGLDSPFNDITDEDIDNLFSD